MITIFNWPTAPLQVKWLAVFFLLFWISLYPPPFSLYSDFPLLFLSFNFFDIFAVAGKEVKTFAHEMLHDCGVDASSIAADGNRVAVLSASDQKILVFQLNYKGSQI